MTSEQDGGVPRGTDENRDAAASSTSSASSASSVSPALRPSAGPARSGGDGDRRADDPYRGAVPAPRRDARVGPPARHPQWLVNQLPVGMLQSDFFVRFVSLFQELGNRLLDDADLVEHVADLTVTPTPMLSTLAGWIGVDTVDASLPESLQRVLLAGSARSLAHRGTRAGLQHLLTMLSGGPAEVRDGGGVWSEGDAPSDPGWVSMHVRSLGHLSEDEFVRLVRDEIPAHVRAELWVGGDRLFSTELSGTGAAGPGLGQRKEQERR